MGIQLDATINLDDQQRQRIMTTFSIFFRVIWHHSEYY